MGKKLQTCLVLLAAVAVSAVTATTASAGHPGAEIYGLTDSNRLLRFGAASPGDIGTSVRVTGIPDRATLIGIDFRPVDGKLWTVARVGTTGSMSRSTRSGEATFVATLVIPGTTAPVVLAGSQFGFDFNPAADALRIVSDAGQNLRALPTPRAAGPAGTTLTDQPQLLGYDRNGRHRCRLHEQ